MRALPCLLLLACSPEKPATPADSGRGAEADADTDADADADADADSDLPHGLSVPAYFYPDLSSSSTRNWAQLLEAPAALGLVVINPSSGPGAAPNSDYAALVGTAQAAGVTILGYVPTTYGARDPAAVAADIAAYVDWYGVDGIFLDEGPGAATCAGLRDTYAAHAAAAGGGLVALNAGTDTCPDYLDFIDVLLLFEDTADRWSPSAAPAWMADHDPAHFWMLAHAVPDEAAALRIRDEATAAGFGHIYLTDDTLPNPWDTLPTFWPALVAATP